MWRIQRQSAIPAFIQRLVDIQKINLLISIEYSIQQRPSTTKN